MREFPPEKEDIDVFVEVWKLRGKSFAMRAEMCIPCLGDTDGFWSLVGT